MTFNEMEAFSNEKFNSFWTDGDRQTKSNKDEVKKKFRKFSTEYLATGVAWILKDSINVYMP